MHRLAGLLILGGGTAAIALGAMQIGLETTVAYAWIGLVSVALRGRDRGVGLHESCVYRGGAVRGAVPCLQSSPRWVFGLFF